MGKGLHDQFTVARETFAEVDATLGFSLSGLMFEGEMAELTQTQNAQPAILATSVALFRALAQERNFQVAERGAFALGHSLGEYSALVATGALSLADAVRLVRRRGEAMQESINDLSKPTTMTALMLRGTSVEALRTHLSGIQPHLPEGETAELANINSAQQVVLSGTEAGVGAAVQELQARQVAARAIDLPVSAPFHCSLMQPAAEVMASALTRVRVGTPCVPLISNVRARPVTTPNDIVDLLVRQVTGTVLWAPSVEYCRGQGVENFIVFGPGKVLANLLRREHPRDKIKMVSELEDVLNFTDDLYDGSK
ncbi:[acyl-carrier-protein] S-malonyltransferase [Tieghemiomyces parasiticus]|uniref:[acyl-carrier-protein] S-malonyltransferase n=1 Tax=Tieghemiomyces parasiticus TaxID=78921 RepID=A0A9W8AIK6_9FUNG|nr:[acyl-carrier-protein] S-malonyltransferase [Tieghemiomyces parasiticus]